MGDARCTDEQKTRFKKAHGMCVEKKVKKGANSVKELPNGHI